MRKFLLIIGVLTSFTSSQQVYAKSTNNIELLIDGCIELVGIYKNKKDKYLLAGHTTSLSEAIKAGYCRGAIEQFIESNPNYCSADWFEIAEHIAALDQTSYLGNNQTAVLEMSCRG